MAAKAKVDPVEARAAQAMASLQSLGVKAGGSSWKLPCAYEACDRTFDPNGVGRFIHTSCRVGTLFFGPWTRATKAGDTSTAEAILAKAKELAA